MANTYSNRFAAHKSAKLHVPFEGDNTLTVIISKALLLTADDQIKDATITRQTRS